jgi:superfamily II DNA or RNA helicase
MVQSPDDGIEYETYRMAQSLGIVKNESRNAMIAEIAEMVSQTGPTLGLVKQKQHGKALEKLVPGSKFVWSQTPSKQQDQALKDLLSGKLPVLWATPIADEGLDLPQLQNLILCDPGKSRTKLYQRIGRTLRKPKGKTHSMVIDLGDPGKYLVDHMRQRKKLYLREEEFVYVDVKPEEWKSIRGIPNGG